LREGISGIKVPLLPEPPNLGPNLTERRSKIIATKNKTGTDLLLLAFLAPHVVLQQ
jgi:hypothetical protein